MSVLIIDDVRTTGSSGGKGSGGGHGGRGGGILFLNISDTLDIEGTLSADGDNYVGSYAGGGSGGSILIRTVTLEGSGTVQVSSISCSNLSKPEQYDYIKFILGKYGLSAIHI